NLRAAMGLELFRRCQGTDEFALFCEHQQLIAGQQERAGSEAVLAPADMAGLQLDATQVATLLLASIEAIEKSIVMNAGSVVIRENVVARPNLFRLRLVEAQEDCARAVTGRQKNQITNHQRHGGANRSTHRRPPRIPEKDLAAGGIERGQAV